MTLPMGNDGESSLASLYSTAAENIITNMAGGEPSKPTSNSVTETDTLVMPPEDPQNTEGYSFDSFSENELRSILKQTLPFFVSNVTITGHHDPSTAEARGEVNGMVRGYFEEIKEKYNCADDSMPYAREFPEYDPTIREAMRQELYSKIAENPQCLTLLRQIGAVYPPPEQVDYDTMVTGNFWSGPGEIVASQELFAMLEANQSR